MKNTILGGSGNSYVVGLDAHFITSFLIYMFYVYIPLFSHVGLTHEK